MIRYENSIRISRPLKWVYDYMTLPGNWMEHLPCTIMVVPALKQAPAVGEKVRETLSLFGFRVQIDWVIERNDRPTHFAIRGTTLSLGGGTSHLTYDFSEEDRTTLVERRITYDQNNRVMRLLEPIGRLYFVYEGKEALKRARVILEAMLDKRG
jgi:hypothetical protein